jgi:hypothetical protein
MHLKPRNHFSKLHSGHVVVSISPHLGQIVLNSSELDLYSIDWYGRDEDEVHSVMKANTARV